MADKDSLQKKLLKNFLRSYLNELRTRQKWHKQHKDLKVHDLVLLQNEQSKRLQWPLGRVIAVTHGRDGLVRTVDVQTQSGTFRRPVQRLVKLELDDD